MATIARAAAFSLWVGAGRVGSDQSRTYVQLWQQACNNTLMLKGISFDVLYNFVSLAFLDDRPNASAVLYLV